MVTLWCAVDGDRSVFSVKVDERNSVHELKKAIKEKQMYRLPANKLELYLTKEQDGTWLTASEAKSGATTTDGMVQFDDEQAAVGSVGLAEKELRGAGGSGPVVHVLVKRPGKAVTLWCAVEGGRSVFSVKVNESNSVDALKKAIKAEKLYTIHCATAALELFLARKQDGSWLTAREAKSGASTTDGMAPLNHEQALVGDVGLAGKDVSGVGGARAGNGPVHVLVKPPNGQSLQVVETIESKRFEEVASKLQDSQEVQGLVKSLTDLHEHSDEFVFLTMPFVVLENSSGTGKTQMAFNLAATDLCDVFYVPVTRPRSADCQSLCAAFDARTRAFTYCVEKDLPKVKVGMIGDFRGVPSLTLYNFIACALCGGSVFHGEGSREDVDRILKQRRARKQKPFVFFLDGFPRVDNLSGFAQEKQENVARMMRNVFRSFHLPVVISATNGTARDLLNPRNGYGPRRQSSSMNIDIPWCEVVPSFPAYVPPTPFDAHPSLQWIVEHSRPLFACKAQQYMEKNLYAGGSGNDRLQYLTDMTRSLAKALRMLKERSAREEFQLGQAWMLLHSSFNVVDGQANLIDGHYGRLVESKPFRLALAGIGTVKDGGSWKWQCSGEFPHPREDMLLHLTLMGGHCYPGRGEASGGRSIQRPLQLPVYQAWRQLSVPYDGMTLEAVVTAAVVLASHRGGFYGVEFPAFLGRLLYELGVADDIDAVTDLPNGLKKDAVVPFLSMPNTEWPEEFLEHWKDSDAQFANVACTTDKHKIDFEVSPNTLSRTGDGDRRLLSGECKDQVELPLGSLKGILNRVPNTSIHLVTVQVLQREYFKPGSLQTADLVRRFERAARVTPPVFQRSFSDSDISTAAQRDVVGKNLVERATDLDGGAPSSDEVDEDADEEPSASASEFLEKVKLRHADFYRVSKRGGVREFKELMDAKASASGVDDKTLKDNGAGKLIIFIEVGDIPKKRRLDEQRSGTSRKCQKLE